MDLAKYHLPLLSNRKMNLIFFRFNRCMDFLNGFCKVFDWNAIFHFTKTSTPINGERRTLNTKPYKRLIKGIFTRVLHGGMVEEIIYCGNKVSAQLSMPYSFQSYLVYIRNNFLQNFKRHYPQISHPPIRSLCW